MSVLVIFVLLVLVFINGVLIKLLVMLLDNDIVVDDFIV